MEIEDSQLESGCKMEKIKNWTESDTNEGFLSQASSETIRGGISTNNEIAGVIVVVCGGQWTLSWDQMCQKLQHLHYLAVEQVEVRGGTELLITGAL